jgi:hypothetical protein
VKRVEADGWTGFGPVEVNAAPTERWVAYEQEVVIYRQRLTLIWGKPINWWVSNRNVFGVLLPPWWWDETRRMMRAFQQKGDTVTLIQGWGAGGRQPWTVEDDHFARLFQG